MVPSAGMMAPSASMWVWRKALVCRERPYVFAAECRRQQAACMGNVSPQQLFDAAQRGDAVQVRAALAWWPSTRVGAAVVRAATAAAGNDHASSMAALCAWHSRKWVSALPMLLGHAVNHGSLHVVAVLLAARASVNQGPSTETPLLMAAVQGHSSCVALLLAAKACVHAAAGCLHLAAKEGHAKVVECLARAKADVLTSNRAGHTPVYYAAAGLHEPTLQVLLDAHADVNKPTHYGALLSAAVRSSRHPSVFRLLLGARADVHATTASGETVLSVAIGQKCPDVVVKLLLRAKADARGGIMRGTMRGMSPIFMAARNGMRSTAELLVRAKADVEGDNGSIASSLAYAFKHVELVEYFKALAGM